MSEVSQEHIDESIKKANSIYGDVVRMAKSNGVVYVSWVMRNFPVNWYGASYIVECMEDEGLCGAWQREGFRSMN